jgi:hypothetical protein
MIVADANAVVFLLVDNPSFSPDVRAAYDRDGAWCAPPLWRSEFLNTLMPYVRSEDESFPGTDLKGAVERTDAAEALIGEARLRSPCRGRLAPRPPLGLLAL